MTYTLTGMTTLGVVTSETAETIAGLVPMTIPFTNSSNNVVMDISGAQRNITITGVYSGTDQAALTTFMGQLNGLIDGEQMGTDITYHSDKSNENILVKVETAISDTPGPQLYFCVYTISMIECMSGI